MALYVTRPRRDEVRIGRGLPSDEARIGRGLPSECQVYFSLVPEAFRCASTKARHSLSNGFFHVQKFKMAECMVSNGDANKSIRHGLIVGVSLVFLL